LALNCRFGVNGNHSASRSARCNEGLELDMRLFRARVARAVEHGKGRMINKLDKNSHESDISASIV
jgi:hypothetical protein